MRPAIVLHIFYIQIHITYTTGTGQYYIISLYNIRSPRAQGRLSLRRSLRCDITTVAALSVAAFGFVLFFPLHPPVLKPNLYLTFGQAQRVCNLNPPSPGQVPVKVELFFQLQRLVTGVCLPAAFPL